jgi:hypothetical protein
MFLCSIDGKLYNDDAVSHSIILKYDIIADKPKEVDIKMCSLCYGLINYKYKLDIDGKYLIPKNDKIKIYKISCNNFDYKSKELDKDDNKCLLTDILKVMKKGEKKKIK